MNINILDVNTQLICLNQNHNEQIIMVALEDSIPIKERLLCMKCLQSKSKNVKMLEIDQFRDLIKEKQYLKEEYYQLQRSKNLSIIKEFQQQMKKIQIKLIQDIQEIVKITQEWINEFENRNDNQKIVNLIESYQFLNQTSQIEDQVNEQIRMINKLNFLKLSFKFKEMIDILDFKSAFDQLKLLEFKCENKNQIYKIQQRTERQDVDQNELQILIENKLESKKNIVVTTLINSVQQQDYCMATAFNYNGQIMIAGSNNDIKVWKFEKGQMKVIKKLTGHTNTVFCLVCSKKINWFASGSRDNTIRCWKQQNNKEWISTKPGCQHTDFVLCLLLNSNEDQLISGSDDNTIKVWTVNCLSNTLNYNYTLDNKHNNFICSITVNELETYLVSCGLDKKIILWNKNNQKKWEYSNEIVNDDSGFRLCFINGYQIIWQQHREGITHFLEIKKGILIKRPELNVELNQESEDHNLFPTIYNKTKQIIVQNHNKYVYIIKKEKNEKLTLLSSPIDCLDYRNWGSLTDDGEYLVIWDFVTKAFRVYQILYE